MVERADIVVIGGGIAGASAAAFVSGEADVVVLEAEERPGYHSTGRSAAAFIANYGPPSVRAVSRASRGFLEDPPDGFSDAPLVAPRGTMLIAPPGQEHLLDEEEEAGVGYVRLTPDEAAARVPLLRKDRLAAALLEPEARDIDVDAVHQGYLRRLRRAGGRLVCDARVESLERRDGLWRIGTRAGDWEAPVVVNAAGAWGDRVAGMAAVKPIGLAPKRRSAAIVETAEAPDVSAWPVTAAVDMAFYFKPEAGKILVSPADETPSEPCDAWPEDIDIAVGVDRMCQYLDVTVTKLDHSWAGLRTFAPDGGLVCGFDPAVEGFFWLVGQGGYGIQTSPAMGQCAAALLLGRDLPAEIAGHGVDAASLSPRRFAA